MDITFIIPSYNSAKYLTADKIDRLSSFGEVIVVDDGSTDDTAEVMKRFPEVKYIRQENRGPGSARNTGWRAASSGIVCFIDADTTVEDNRLAEKILGGFSSDEIAAVGGTYTIENPEKFLARCIQAEIVERHKRLPDNPKFLGSFILAVRKEVLEEVDGFNESFRLAQDADLSYRIIARGYKLKHVKDLAVGHYHPESIIKYLRKQTRHAFYRMKIYHAHPNIIAGDDYASKLDLIQPPLAALSTFFVLLTCVLLFSSPLLFTLISAAISCGLLLILLILQLSLAISVAKRKRNPCYLLMILMTYPRSFARAFGMIVGFICFLWF